MNKAIANTAIELAKKHSHNGAAMQDSAMLCLSDAIQLFDKCDYEYAYKRAVRSLGYSVGVFHPDHKQAVAIAI